MAVVADGGVIHTDIPPTTGATQKGFSHPLSPDSGLYAHQWDFGGGGAQLPPERGIVHGLVQTSAMGCQATPLGGEHSVILCPP